MLKTARLCLLSALLMPLFFSSSASARGTMSDAQVKQAIIDESVSAYPGTCACPWNHARNGSACGRRSAWSKEGGYSPTCYKNEVTKEMIKEWRASHSDNN